MSCFRTSSALFVVCVCWCMAPAATDAADATPANGAARAAEADRSAVLLGGAFTRLGIPRLALLTLADGQPHPHAPQVDGVRTTLHIGGSFIIAGEFQAVAGQPRAGLARLAHDGTLDPSWRPTVTGAISALASSGDRLYLGGSFSSVNGVPHANLAALTLSNGSNAPWRADTDGPVLSLACTADLVVVGGSFTTVNGEPHQHLARLAAEDGTPDPKFIGGADGDVRALALRGDQLYIGGTFSRINSEDRISLARLDLTTGNVDAGWRNDVDGSVFALSAEFGYLYLGGSFSAVNSQLRGNLARLQLDHGTLDAWAPIANEQVAALREVGADRVLIAGRFNQIDDTRIVGMAALNAADGTLQSSWKSPELPSGSTPTGLAAGGGQVVAAVSRLDGLAAAGMAWIDANGHARGGLALDGNRPRLLCALPDGAWLYAGGDFSLIDGRPLAGLVRLGRAHGELDASWRCDADAAVRALARSGDELIAGGDFTRLGGQATARLARIDPTTGSVAPWPVVIDGAVQAVLPDGDAVLIAGTFTTIDRQAQPGLARLRLADGKPDPSFNGALINSDGPGTGFSLVRLAPDRVAIGGRFASVGATPIANLAVINPRTGSLQQWEGSADGPVFALALHDGRLAVGGGFTRIGDTARARVAVLDATSGRATAWQADADAEVRTLAIAADALWLGGDFSRIGGTAALHLAARRWTDASPLATPGSDARIESIIALGSAH